MSAFSYAIHHAASIPLILSTQTGLVSPQFRCVFDEDFDTVKKEQHDTSILAKKSASTSYSR